MTWYVVNFIFPIWCEQFKCQEGERAVVGIYGLQCHVHLGRQIQTTHQLSCYKIYSFTAKEVGSNLKQISSSKHTFIHLSQASHNLSLSHTRNTGAVQISIQILTYTRTYQTYQTFANIKGVRGIKGEDGESKGSTGNQKGVRGIEGESIHPHALQHTLPHANTQHSDRTTNKL